MAKTSQPASKASEIPFIDDAALIADGAEITPPDGSAQAPQAASLSDVEAQAPQGAAEGWSALDAASRAQDAAPAPHTGPRLPPLPKMSAQEEAKLKPRLYRVTQDCEVGVGGARVLMRTGRVISANHYNVPGLVQQGLQVVPHKAP